MYCYNCMNNIEDGTFCHHCMRENTPGQATHHIMAGTMLSNKYIVGNAIGEGGFGITYIGKDINLDKCVAIKEFFPAGSANRNNTVNNTVSITSDKKKTFFEKGKNNFINEARSLAKYDNEEGVVDVVDCFQENNTAYIVMEYLDGVNLNEYIKKNGIFKADELFRLMIPIMKSLSKMHYDGIIHRDISPDNIMYINNNSTLKLMDFGSARFFTNADNNMSIILKEGYAPEEQYRKNGKQGPWTDVYGMCATIYKCITGKSPDDGLDRLYEDTLKRPSEYGVQISKPLENILMYGLAVFSENRCQSMQELIDLTVKALGNEQVSVPDPVNGNDRKTRYADENYRKQVTNQVYNDDKTSFADSVNTTVIDSSNAYAANSNNNDMYTQVLQDTPKVQQNNTWQNQPDTTASSGTNTQDKSKYGILGGIAVVCVLVIIASIGYWSSKNDTTDTSSSEYSYSSSSDDDDYYEQESEVTESSQVKMINCVDKNLDDIESELDELGINYKTTYKYDKYKKRGKVIKQSVTSGTMISPDEEVTLTVTGGAENAPNTYEQLITVTASAGSTSATMVLYTWDYDGYYWKKDFSCNACVGKNGISSNYGEGIAATPKGTWKVGDLMASSYSVDTGLDIYKVSSNTVIPYDSKTAYRKYYNRILENTNSVKIDAEPVGKDIVNGRYNYVIFIEHNGDGYTEGSAVFGKGSSITICGVNDSLSPTGGCIDIWASDMRELASLLDSSKDPYIQISTK